MFTKKSPPFDSTSQEILLLVNITGIEIIEIQNGQKKVKELNFFLPVTDAYDTNNIWVESEEGKEDYHPINAKYGQVVMWDGSNLLHGNKTNIENTTRISFDFRVIKAKNYIPSNKGSINTNTVFAIGGYYDKI